MRNFLLYIPFLLMLGCATHNQVRVNTTENIQIKKLALVIPDSGTFEVQYARLRQNATSTVLFGAIGYAIEANYHDSQDAKKEGEIIRRIEDLDCSGSVRSNMVKVFSDESDIQVEVFTQQADVSGSYDAIAEFNLDECGFTLGDQDSEKLSPYVTLSAKVTSSEGQIIWDDREKFVGGEGYQFHNLVEEDGAAKRLMDELLNEASAG